MDCYLVEAHTFEIEFNGRTSKGVRGQALPTCDRRSETIYLHVLALAPAEVSKMKVRIDDDGNKEHDRWALPSEHFAGVNPWWVAVEGGHAWPRYPDKPLCSRCDFDAKGIPRPRPLDEGALTRLRGLGADLP
jgi:hypothetical protein